MSGPGSTSQLPQHVMTSAEKGPARTIQLTRRSRRASVHPEQFLLTVESWSALVRTTVFTEAEKFFYSSLLLHQS